MEEANLDIKGIDFSVRDIPETLGVRRGGGLRE